MSRQLTAKTTLDSLKKQAKRWLRDLRTGDASARTRLLSALPQAPADPGLRDIQRALALEYGYPGWPALREALTDLALARRSHGDRVAEFLRQACVSYRPEGGGDLGIAVRILARHPEIARDSLATAIVCGDLDEVRRRLAADPAAAVAKTGSLDWEPLLYLAYARLPTPAAADSALAIAESLLDRGADPNAWFNDGWDNPFKVVTGAIALGEGVKPPHPKARELVELLIARGADPYDSQALYNTGIVDDDVSWLELLYGHSARLGETSKWTDPRHRLGGQIDRGAIDFLLGLAVSCNHLRRAEWLLKHGADADGLNAYSRRKHHEEAQLLGHGEIAELLVRHGARQAPLQGHGAFQAACLALERGQVRAMVERDPELLRLPGPLLLAASQGRADVVRMLLELGVSPGLADQNGVTALHNAAQSGAVEVGKLLLDHGAEVDAIERRFGAAPLGWASHLKQPAMVDLLAAVSRDVHSLTSEGRLERLGAVLSSEPALANALGTRRKVPPLFCLPDDEALAERTAELLLAHGADPRIVDADGLDARGYALKRGLDGAAELMGGPRHARRAS
jgi:hypothetical protein